MAAADVWPPQPFDIAFARFAEHDAWYSGDTSTLAEIYQGKIGPATHIRAGVPYRGGVIGSLSKFWWGQPIQANEARMKMHLPVPADLAQLSADLLFAEAPKIRYAKPGDTTPAKPDESADSAPAKPSTPWKHPGQDRLDEIMGSDEAHAEMLKGGEFAASLGGTYFAVVWDEQLADHVWFRAYASDCAIPTFRYGKLVACTLWTEYQSENAGATYRLLEIHNPGTITYELHEGGPNNLGRAVPLSTHPETAHYETLRSPAEIEALGELAELAEIANPSVTVSTGVPNRLAVVYMPNIKPTRDWRKLGAIAELGRSDFAGNEDIFDKIDQTWSSLMRDIENGAGRLTVPEQYLETSSKPGEGAAFDPNRQVYSGINALGSAGDSLSSQITISQFEIRVEEHLAAIDGLKRELATACGYSPVHLGLKDAQGTKTATEVSADLSDSERTRDKKALYAKPALAQLAQVALAIDGNVFPGKGGRWYDEMPDIEFAEVSQVDPLKNAQTIQVLESARAAAVKTRVRMAHPDWDDTQVEKEAEEIAAEQRASAAPDPATFTGVADPTAVQPPAGQQASDATQKLAQQEQP